MKIIDVSDFSFEYLNILLRKLKKGKLTESKFVKLQNTLYLWTMNYYSEEEEDD